MVHLDNFKIYHYPDGHKHVVSDKDLQGDTSLQVRIKSFDDLFLAAQVRAIHPELTHLYIWYMLGGRCDRRFSPGEALDLKIVCDYINSMGWEYIGVTKPHSPKTLEFLQKGSYAYDPTLCLLDKVKRDLRNGRVCYVSPDAGASQWINNYDLPSIIQGSKKRDPKTGAVTGVQFIRTKIDGTEIDALREKEGYDNFVIVDDLCDGGGTFIAIAKEIKMRYPNAKVYLVVTHAIFSKGFEPFEGLIDGIYCTNSFADWNNPLVKQIKL